MFLAGNPFGSVECDLEDALDEIEAFPVPTQTNAESSFIGIENDQHEIINLVHLTKEGWAVVIGSIERTNLSYSEIKTIISDFWQGKLPDWANQKLRNDFPDGIDEFMGD
jgi:hypothetical protein